VKEILKIISEREQKVVNKNELYKSLKISIVYSIIGFFILFIFQENSIILIFPFFFFSMYYIGLSYQEIDFGNWLYLIGFLTNFICVLILIMIYVKIRKWYVNS
jgi:hypothetical protein